MDIEFKKQDNKLILDLETLTPDQIKALADKLNFGMVISLMKSLNEIDSASERLNSAKSKLANYICDKIEVDIDANVLSYKEALDLLTNFSNISISVAEVKRKVFNGKDLFKTDLLSKEERAMLDLLKTVNTDEKKQRLVEFINSIDDFE